MPMPRRQYVVQVKRRGKTLYYPGVKLKEAIELANLKAGERFEYGVFEHGNLVECEVTAVGPAGTIKYSEFGHRPKHWWQSATGATGE